MKPFVGGRGEEMRQYVAIFSNFVFRFGIEIVLLDYADQIVFPAFSYDLEG